MQPPRVPIEDTVFAHIGNRFPGQLVAALTGLRDPRVEVVPVRLPLVRKVEADFAVKVYRPPPRHVLHIEHWSSRGRLARTALYQMWYHDATGWPVRTVIVTTHRRLARAVPRVYRFRAGPGPPTQLALSALHLWRMRAADVLARRQVALYPFVPVMRDPRPPEVLLRELRDRIMADAETEPDREALLPGAAFVAARSFPQALVLAVFGGKEEMAKIDLAQEFVEMGWIKAQRAGILEALDARFGAVPDALRKRIEAVSSSARLNELLRKAVTARSRAAFAREL